jgi:hypothetical protein
MKNMSMSLLIIMAIAIAGSVVSLIYPHALCNAVHESLCALASPLLGIGGILIAVASLGVAYLSTIIAHEKSSHKLMLTAAAFNAIGIGGLSSLGFMVPKIISLNASISAMSFSALIGSLLLAMATVLPDRKTKLHSWRAVSLVTILVILPIIFYGVFDARLPALYVQGQPNILLNTMAVATTIMYLISAFQYFWLFRVNNKRITYMFVVGVALLALSSFLSFAIKTSTDTGTYTMSVMQLVASVYLLRALMR